MSEQVEEILGHVYAHSLVVGSVRYLRCSRRSSGVDLRDWRVGWGELAEGFDVRCVPDVVVGRCVPEFVGVGLLGERERSDWVIGRSLIIQSSFLSFSCLLLKRSNLPSTPTSSLPHSPSSRSPLVLSPSTPPNAHKSAHPNRRSRAHGLAHEATSELRPCKENRVSDCRQRNCNMPC